MFNALQAYFLNGTATPSGSFATKLRIIGDPCKYCMDKNNLSFVPFRVVKGALSACVSWPFGRRKVAYWD